MEQLMQSSLNTEFLYLGSLLKIIAPTLTCNSDKVIISKWIQRLFAPEYQTSKLKEKRNIYLSALVMTILNDELCGVFKHSPPEGALTDLDNIKPQLVPASEWETDKMWQEILLELPDDFDPLKCPLHQSENECKRDNLLNTILDQEFQLLLYIARPYAALLKDSNRVKIAAWLQILCSVHGNACSSMRSIRNDYMMALLGYLNDLRLAGPFTRLPPQDFLKPLGVVAEQLEEHPLIDPTGPTAEEFLSIQPIPEDGAFCYIALTGELLGSSLGPHL